MKKVKNCTKLVPFFARDGRLRPEWTLFTLFGHYFQNTHSRHYVSLSTKYERLLTSLLTSEFKNVARIASLSVESTEELRSQLSNFIANTVDAGYMNTGYKNMPVIRTIKNHLMENGSRISYIKHAGYKNIPDIRISFLLPRVFL